MTSTRRTFIPLAFLFPEYIAAFDGNGSGQTDTTRESFIQAEMMNRFADRYNEYVKGLQGNVNDKRMRDRMVDAWKDWTERAGVKGCR